MPIYRTIVLGLALALFGAGCSEAPRPAATAQPPLPFEQADLDRSGDLSTQEAVLVPGLDLLAVDKDRDGTVSHEEYQAWAGGERGTVAGTADGSAKR